MKFQSSVRLQKLPPYIFSEIQKRKKEVAARQIDLIDLGMGDPDLATPPTIVNCLIEEARKTENHHYPPYNGIPEFRQAVCRWMERRFSVTADPDKEVINLIGSKEGIANFSQAIFNPGDFCLVPDPAYPVYTNAALLAGASPLNYPLRASNAFRPKWSEISEEVWRAIKLIFINFPNNPTSATVSIDTYRELVSLAQKYDFMICSDNPYSEQSYHELAPCLLQVPGAKEVGIEFFSCSKTYNMTGWRIGFAVGNPDLVSALYKMKSAIDTGIFKPIQWAAIAALDGKERELVNPSKEVFHYRRNLMKEGLEKLGYEIFDGGATFYLWIKTPMGEDSMSTCTRLLEKGIVTTPGIGFGKQGEGYFRMSLTVPEEKIKEVLERMPAAEEAQSQIS